MGPAALAAPECAVQASSECSTSLQLCPSVLGVPIPTGGPQEGEFAFLQSFIHCPGPIGPALG